MDWHARLGHGEPGTGRDPGSASLVGLHLLKRIIDTLQSAIAVPGGSSSFRLVLFWVALAAAVETDAGARAVVMRDEDIAAWLRAYPKKARPTAEKKRGHRR